jgi:hypothetical protein
MQDHCHEGETNCWFSIFRVFPSDHIPKAMVDVNEHFSTHSFTFRDELIIDHALAIYIKKKIKCIVFPLSLSTLNFLLRGGGGGDLHSEDSLFLWIIPCNYVVNEFVVFNNHIDEVTRNAYLCSFFSGGIIQDTKC